MRLVRIDAGVAIERDGGAPLVIRQIIGVGRNYAEHAKERGAAAPERPMLFCKNLGALALDGDAIALPRACADREQVDFEGELAVVIGRDARDVTEAQAADPASGVILGYCCANDVSARWWQKEGAGGQFFRGKSFDTFCPLGPRVTPAGAVPDPQALCIVTRVGGETMQDGSTADMLFPVATLVSEISRGMTLVAGTVLLTGTPPGVGAARTPPRFLRAGDTVEVEITGFGTLTNTVRAE
jgi:2-keto-4-pentenoate hydratase/2-oxohepta-3-ene-1,7-dioic acid hydratase in catechol pathway